MLHERKKCQTRVILVGKINTTADLLLAGRTGVPALDGPSRASRVGIQPMILAGTPGAQLPVLPL